MKMNANTALEFIDPLIYEQTGKYLNDLERAVFIGSWEGKTYTEVYPSNPEYIEKYVGYRLWQKVSDALGEKVTKKQVRGALERAMQRQSLQDLPSQSPSNGASTPMDAGAIAPDASASHGTHTDVAPFQPKRVLISYRCQAPDSDLAQALQSAMADAGHPAYTVSTNPAANASPQSTREWLHQIDEHLAHCDYLVLLLSPQAAVSEMIIEELRKIRERCESHLGERPTVLTIRVQCPAHLELNHDLQIYLHNTQTWEWQSQTDTAAIAQSLLVAIAEAHQVPPLPQLRSTSPPRQPPLRTNPENHHMPALPPSPVADPELPQGQVRLDSKFYVERVPDEGQCYREIIHAGTLIRIKAPRQMGKTSLMSRILDQARDYGYRTVPLSFQHADKAVFSSLDQLLQWFCARIARKLHLSPSITEYWSDIYGSKDNCTAYFEDCILPTLDGPLVLGLDEVDRVFQYPKIADDFFGLLRAWYEEAGYGDSDSGLWEKLRLVVVHSTEVYIPLDVNQSPFNVGLPIELSEFRPEQVQDLAHRHGLPWGMASVEQLMQMVGGHPYLVRLALYHICKNQVSLAELIETAPTESGIYGDHLRRHLWNLQQHLELIPAFSRVLDTPDPVELESRLAFKLHSLGLVQLQGNEVRLRFELYRRYFSDRLKPFP